MSAELCQVGSGTGGHFDLLDDGVTWIIVGKSDAAGTYSSKVLVSQVIASFNARMSEGLKPKIRQIANDGDKVIIFFDARGSLMKTPMRGSGRCATARVVRVHNSIAFNDLCRRVSP